MISKQTFAGGWEVLLERFGKDLDRDEANRYYAYCTARLSDYQFVKAAERIWAEFKRFPRPVDFVESAPADPEAVKQLEPANEHDPWFMPVHRILKGSPAEAKWRRQLQQRRAIHAEIEDHSGPPWYFPTPRVEIIAHEDLIGVIYEDRPDLRAMWQREAAASGERGWED